MAIYCGVCATRLYDGSENYGGFQVSPSFQGIYTSKYPHINDACKSCHDILVDVITQAANKIVADNSDRVEARKNELQKHRDHEEKTRQEKLEFEQAWNARRSGK